MPVRAYVCMEKGGKIESFRGMKTNASVILEKSVHTMNCVGWDESSTHKYHKKNMWAIEAESMS